MKFLTISACALSFSVFQPAFAAEEFMDPIQDESIVVEQLDDEAVAAEATNPEGLLSAEDALTDETLLRRRDGDRGRRWDGRRPGHRHGRPGWHRRPGWRWRWPYPGPHNDMITCFARNGRGVTFRASGWNSSFNLQRRALIACRSNSRNPSSCYAVGCR